ncbi:hypothetical protein BASA82_000856 [Batrachochytrium salamandrivorans]|nr:hypothetical protein BASA82_000856 [Batrachochytrium salamandrivorans]
MGTTAGIRVAVLLARNNTALIMDASSATTAVSSPIEASSAGRPLTWTQQYSRPLSAFLLFTSLAFLTLENIRLQLEHNVMEEDQLAEIAGLTTKRQKLREQLILAQQQQPNP